ncbi:MAG: LptF/LptG family permease [Gemmatimonadales bacterium]|nr:LptF/LptG family permease [Gemmatimonadales bacterium]NIN11436.1 LptF/LptG family permease [Gemmatimonadales bacterium]NIN50045.1 LptF/LptG family permease [Gemmatimonadales bacterium]NIP07509.1 LptF/LptG family permease [Gemmatimonadales bacterium]NIR03151.1 LptF/LptG family permease [Gemmatimonadales bacterium]
MAPRLTLPILDRYLLREWVKIFLAAAVGFPLFVILIELAEKLDDYLVRDLELGTIALAYLFSIPEKMVDVLPAAVLFGTVFSIGAMNRHSELAAAKASGLGVHRIVVPVFVAAVLAAGLDLVIVELAPPATRRQLELLGVLETRSQRNRYNFVYRAEAGWVYTVRELTIDLRRMRHVVLEREGSGTAYPSLAIQARRAQYSDSAGGWTLADGRFRIMTDSLGELSFAFDSMRNRGLVEDPAALLAEPKEPKEMRYAELGRYIDALERSGGDGRRLRVDRALKVAVPATCIIIALFAAPLAVVGTGARQGGAFSIAVALGTTVVFLVLVQLSRTIAIGGALPPTLAAWLPNMAFGTTGAWMLKRAPT